MKMVSRETVIRPMPDGARLLTRQGPQFAHETT